MPNVSTLTDKLCRIIGHTRLPGVNRLLWKAGKLSRSVDTEFEAAMFTLSGRRRPALTPFDWNAEEAVCIPKERAHAFEGMIAR